MSSLWVESLALILTPASVILVIGFLGRSAVKQFLDRNLEAHKAALSASSERQLESLKADFRHAAYEHEVLFGKLHAERAEGIKVLYQKTLSLGNAGRAFASGEGVTNTEEFEATRKTLEACLKAVYEQMFEIRIFLSEELCVKIDELLGEIRKPATDIAGGYMIPLQPPEERFQALLSDKRKLEEATWNLEGEVAAEFRKLLGVK